MTLRLSTALRDFINNHGSLKDALHDGEIKIYTGAQPSTPEAAPTGTLLCTLTANSASRTAEVQATGTATLAGSSGSVTSITVDGVEILGATVPFNTSLSQTASDVADQINKYRSQPNYTASASGAVVTIKAPRGMGATANSKAVVTAATTMTSTDVDMSGGVSAANGLRFGVSADGVLVKDAAQTWSGVAVATGTAGWFRFTGSVADSGALDSTAGQVRLDGAISTSASQLNMSSTSITSGATQTISAFPLTLPAS